MITNHFHKHLWLLENFSIYQNYVDMKWKIWLQLWYSAELKMFTLTLLLVWPANILFAPIPQAIKFYSLYAWIHYCFSVENCCLNSPWNNQILLLLCNAIFKLIIVIITRVIINSYELHSVSDNWHLVSITKFCGN